MEFKHFIVKFKGFSINIIAGTKEEAKILAQSRAIYEGKNWDTVKSVRELKPAVCVGGII